MSNFLFLTIAPLLVVIILMMKSLLIANESERFALFTLGRFDGYRGPGLFFVAPFITRATRIKVGDTGTLISSGFANFSKVEVPVSGVDSLSPGATIRVTGFSSDGLLLAPAPIGHTSRCPKCGHEY